MVIQNLKKKLEDAKEPWPLKLPEVLSAYRTMAKSSTDETPFSLVYGAEASIPVEVGSPIPRYDCAQEQANSEAMLVQLDLLEEHRDLAFQKTRTVGVKSPRRLKTEAEKTQRHPKILRKGRDSPLRGEFGL
ncbi:uncharacterized protein LOC132039494 [Lycium ferocissimum]|uniref:uncharacterized protein LOC132039494 n=1 Tax=Lycium ferocissimum TaxID=112874 RepID=UPI002814A70B|nr:uncharacterized protein LOC132039494 [Lycium ferocissimum]